MKNLIVLSSELFFFIKAPLQKEIQCVCYFICFILIIIDFKMVIKELLGSTDLKKSQVLCIHKLLEVIMVGKNKNPMFVAF